MTHQIGPAETRARQRYIALNAVRIGSLGAVILGIAAARGVVDLPYALGVALALGGLIAFYFPPRWLARRWKSDAGDAPK